MDDEGATQCVVKAMYNFVGTGDDELTFQKGDLIMVTKVYHAFMCSLMTSCHHRSSRVAGGKEF